MRSRILNAFVWGVVALLPISVDASDLAGSRPNIILVLTDDQGMGDLSCMGNPILKTPHIDSFYQKATRFTDFQVSPTCAPTRSGLMSGRAPFKNGVSHTIFQRERMSLETFTIAQALQSAGYTTGLFGKWHLGDGEDYLPQNRGFDEVLMHGAGGIGQEKYGDFPANSKNTYFDSVLLHNDTIVKTKGFCTDLFFRAALAWINQQRQSNQPYFAYVALNAPHSPYIAPEKYKKRFLDEGYDDKTAGRYGMIENIDDNFGMFVAKLESWNELDNTLLIFMTDNGMANGFTIRQNGKRITPFNAGLNGVKNSPHEGGTHVPAFWYWKDVLGEGVDIDALVAHLDLYKTFTELAGAQLPEKMQELDGRSLMPLLEDPKSEWPDRELFIHSGRWAAGRMDGSKFKNSAVRTEQWRFVNNRELYDITADPGERNEVSASHPEVIERLRKSYDQWWASVQPLLVNEGLPTVAPQDQPLAIRYDKQLNDTGIPLWEPATE
ncbi:Arylsulfatase [Novipirellula aureliae]|uniref:Arylsulfatase n=1 Tax=Novipirellula aureliae TaxID=2527966 RepID=A0A5C6DQF3_9BACT|nr:arylsulfatase [Novipirellula aureliae]TWU38852.1 Arylsulfatase [Novipirellula aureliae]